MKPNKKYLEKNADFWAYVKLLSERLGYSKNNFVISHNIEDAELKLMELNIEIEDQLLNEALEYIEYRSKLLNSISNELMNADEAKKEFNKNFKKYKENNFTCKLPMNKQKHEKANKAFLTGIVNILAEETIRKFAKDNSLIYDKDIGFDCDPKRLSYVLDEANKLKGIFSRRFDGALPSINNAHLVWEIKEYYYTTTFGSRIADGVYETQLDGYEARTIKNDNDIFIKHIYIIDSYDTWWNKGKSYLCRIVDMLNMGLVDEVLIGKEVTTRWPIIVSEVLEYYKDNFVEESNF